MAERSGAEQVVRHAARRIGLQAAALVAIVVLALTTLAMWITGRQQRDTDHQLVADTAVVADDVVDPPPNCWLVLREGAGPAQATPGLPAGVPGLEPTAGPLPVGGVDERDLWSPGGHYLVLTRKRSASETVQVVLDLGPADERHRALLAELGVAAGAGLLLVGGVGLLLVRRVLSPLRRTMDLQRQFVADASHELRAPLTLLHTRAQLLERELAGAGAPVRDEAAGLVRTASGWPSWSTTCCWPRRHRPQWSSPRSSWCRWPRRRWRRRARTPPSAGSSWRSRCRTSRCGPRAGHPRCTGRCSH